MAAEMQVEESSGVGVSTFKEKILGFDIHFYILRMRQSFFVWIGTEPNLEALSVAMQTRFVSPLTSQLVECNLPLFIDRLRHYA